MKAVFHRRKVFCMDSNSSKFPGHVIDTYYGIVSPLSTFHMKSNYYGHYFKATTCQYMFPPATQRKQFNNIYQLSYPKN